MPARRESRSNHAGQDGSPAAPTEAEAVDAATTEGAGADGTENAPDEDVPMNRAERRAKAKGKHGSQVQPPVGKIVPGRTNQAHGHRSYSNRRSGG